MNARQQTQSEELPFEVPRHVVLWLLIDTSKLCVLLTTLTISIHYLL